MKLQQQFLHDLTVERERLGMSVKRLCKCACIPESTYYRWMSGAFTPNLRTLDRVFAALRKIKPKQ